MDAVPGLRTHNGVRARERRQSVSRLRPAGAAEISAAHGRCRFCEVGSSGCNFDAAVGRLPWNPTESPEIIEESVSCRPVSEQSSTPR